MKTFNHGLRQLNCLNNKRCWECYAWTPCDNDGNWYLRPSSNQHCSWVSHWHDDLFRENPPNERTIWEHQSSMKLERKLGINQREERKLIGWTIELKKKRPLLLLRFFLFLNAERAARNTKVSLRKVGTHGTIGWLIAKIIGRYWDLKRGKWLGLILGHKT